MSRDMVLGVDADTGQARDELGRFARTAEDTTTVTGRNFGSMARLTAIATGAMVAAVGSAIAVVGTLGQQSVSASREYESSFAGIRKTVSATHPEFGELSRQLRDLSKEIPINVNELNRVGEAAGQLGIEKQNLVGFTDTMAKLGVTTNLSSEEAATALAKLANITQMPQENFERLGSTVVDLGNNFATTERDIVEFGTRMAGAGEIIGLSEADILSFGAALSSVGITAEAGGTAMQKVMIEIADAVKTGGERLETFADISGTSADLFKRKFEQDAAGAIIDFVEGLGRINEQGGNVFATLESVEFQNERVRRALLSAAGAGDILRTAVDRGNQAWRENTALAKEAEQRFNTFDSQWQILKNSINDVAISVGLQLLPILKEAVGAVREYINNEGPAIAEAVGVFLVQALQIASEAVGAFGTAILKAREFVGQFGQTVTGFTAILTRWERDSQEKFVKQLEAQGKASDGARARLEELNGRVEATGESFVDWVTWTNDAEASTATFTSILERGEGVLERMRAQVVGGSDELQTLLVPAAKNVLDLVGPLPEAYGEWTLSIADNRGEIDQHAADVEFAIPLLIDYVDVQKQNAKVVREQEKAMRQQEKAVREASRAQQEFFNIIRTGITWLDSLVQGVFKLVDSLVGGGGLQGALGGVGDMVSGIFGQQGNIGGQLAGGMLSRLGGSSGLLSMFGVGGAATGGATAAGTGIPILGGLGMLPGGLFGGGGAAAAGTTAATGGGIFGGLGASLGGLFTNPITGIAAALGLGGFGLFKLLTKSQEEARTERQGGIFGEFNIGEGLSKELAQISIEATKAGRALPDTIASIVGFDDVIKAVGISTLPQFMMAMNKGDEAVMRLKEGLITGAEAAEFFGTDALKIMQNAAIELGGTAVAEFELMIDKAVEAGITISQEFIGATGTATTEIQKQIELLESQLVGATQESAILINMQLQDLYAQMETGTLQTAVTVRETMADMVLGIRDEFGDMRDAYADELRHMSDDSEDFYEREIGGSTFKRLTADIAAHFGRREISNAFGAEMARSAFVADLLARDVGQKLGVVDGGGFMVPGGPTLAIEGGGGFQVPRLPFDDGGHALPLPRIPFDDGGVARRVPGGRGDGGRRRIAVSAGDEVTIHIKGGKDILEKIEVHREGKRIASRTFD